MGNLRRKLSFTILMLYVASIQNSPSAAFQYFRGYQTGIRVMPVALVITVITGHPPFDKIANLQSTSTAQRFLPGGWWYAR